MSKHRSERGAVVSPCRWGRFCFVLGADPHASFSHRRWQAASCVRVSSLSEQQFSSINHLITHSSISKIKMMSWIRLELATPVELVSEVQPGGPLQLAPATLGFWVQKHNWAAAGTLLLPPPPLLFVGVSLGISMMRRCLALCLSPLYNKINDS